MVSPSSILFDPTKSARAGAASAGGDMWYDGPVQDRTGRSSRAHATTAGSNLTLSLLAGGITRPPGLYRPTAIASSSSPSLSGWIQFDGTVSTISGLAGRGFKRHRHDVDIPSGRSVDAAGEKGGYIAQCIPSAKNPLPMNRRRHHFFHLWTLRFRCRLNSELWIAVVTLWVGSYALCAMSWEGSELGRLTIPNTEHWTCST